MKRNIFSAICLATVALLSASCSQDNETGGSASMKPATNKRVTFKGVAESIDGGTRAYNAYCYEVRWNESDQIYVTNGTSDDTFTLTDGKDTPTGVFTEDNEKGVTGNIEAFYPASLKADDGYVWPATQSNNQVAPMYAKQEIKGTANEVVSFSSLGGMLQIAFSTKTEGITVTSITLEHNKKPLSGKFTVDENGQAIMAEDQGHTGVMLDLGENGVPVGVAAKYFYIAIPAGTYSTAEKDEVMTITFRDDVHGKVCMMTSTTFPEVKRNTVGRITLAKDFTDQPLTVRFDMNNTDKTGNFTTKPGDIKVVNNNTIVAPAMPFAENYAFRGWYKDAGCTEPWNFSTGVTADMTLYAKWTADPEGNKINGHDCVKLAGYYWATENAKYESYLLYNEDNFYYYTQTYAPVAAQSWGSSWNLPSEAQWQALIDNCNWNWTDEYDNSASPYYEKSGYLVTGKGENYEDGHSIFLPAAGYYDNGTSSIINQSSNGCYWSADEGILLYFTNDFQGISISEQSYGMAVRPVSE